MVCNRLLQVIGTALIVTRVHVVAFGCNIEQARLSRSPLLVKKWEAVDNVGSFDCCTTKR